MFMNNDALKEKFERFKKNLTEKSAATNNAGWNSEKHIKLAPGNTYQTRLVYTTEEGRDNPFIEKYVHVVQTTDDAGKTKKNFALCPKTYFPRGFYQKCPMCRTVGQLFKNANGGKLSGTDKAIYDKLHPKFHGYALVYVVNDPLTPENNGHVKILHYDKKSKPFFDKEVFGITKNGDQYNEGVGMDAFNFENGYNLILEVTKNGEFNDYAFSFARKPSPIQLSESDVTRLKKEIDEIVFTSKELIGEYKQETLDEFYEKHILANTPNVAKNSSSAQLAEEMMEEEEVSFPVANQQAKPALKQPPPPFEVEKGERTVEDISTEMDDIDALLNEVPNK